MSTVSDPPIPPFLPEGIIGHPLATGMLPRRIVVIRLHAFGDTVITFPLLAGLRDAMPHAQIVMVTAEGIRDLVAATGLVDEVWGIPFSGSRAGQIAALLRLTTAVGSPDLFLDLQRSRLSSAARRLLRPRAWVAFDRFAPRPALDRYMEAARWVGLPSFAPGYGLNLPTAIIERAARLLAEHGLERRDGSPVVCLNPAGCWPTKNWPFESYIRLAELLIQRWGARLILLGTDNIRPGADAIVGALPGAIVDLVGSTSAVEAMAMLGRLDLVIGDDSGLMHMAWCAGTPTLTLFGASRSTWSRPMGAHTAFLGSEDLPCGACMRPWCQRGDILCLRRHPAEEVLEIAARLIGRP